MLSPFRYMKEVIHHVFSNCRKTGTVEEEITQGKKAIQILGGKIEKVEKLMLPDSDISRSFVFIRKEKQTPKAYPRKAGTASKQPLG